jgi:hypothetical protein
MQQTEPDDAGQARAPRSRSKKRASEPARSSPAKSRDKAEAAFRDFSMSRFASGARPASYVDPADGPAAVHSAQRRIITQHLDELGGGGAAGPAAGGMTLALPPAQIGKLLPSLDADAATIDLTDVLNVIGQHLRGTEFFASGNPVLNRIALQARARQLIALLNGAAE